MDFAKLNYVLLMPFYIHMLRKKKDEGSDIIKQLRECRRKGNSVLLSLCPLSLVP